MAIDWDYERSRCWFPREEEGDSMSERKTSKLRTCLKCRKDIQATAAELKAHAKTCTGAT